MSDLLTEEMELFELMQGADPVAADRAALELVAANCEKIWLIARSMARDGEKWTPADLYQEGAQAMIRFAQRWKPQPGVPFFGACRQRVRGSMQDFLRRKADAVRHQREQPRSLDMGSEDGGRTLGECLPCATVPVNERFTLPDTLSKQEREVLELRVFTEPPESVARAAKVLGWRVDRVRQVQRRAMRKVRACGGKSEW